MTLVLAHLPLARHIASRYARDDRHDDYAQEAALGLVQAARVFDPARGVPFGAFARQYVVTRCQRYRRSDHAIALPRCRNVEPIPYVDVREDEDPETMLSERQERAARIAWLALAMAKLSTRERMVVERHFLEGETQADIAASIGVSRAAVTQSVAAALRKMRGRRVSL